MANLPEWFLKELPKIEKPGRVVFKEDKYYAVHPNGDETEFETVDDAYDHIKKEWELEVLFDKNLPNKGHGKRVWGKKDKYGTRILGSYTDKSKIRIFEKNYEEFLGIAEKYQNNPNDFAIVYKFVDKHPAFWNKYSEENPWAWATDGHCAHHNGRLHLEPLIDEDGNYEWLIETGKHVAPEYNSRYFDYRLTATGKTVEEAFIKLAFLINKFFNLDGTEKEDVPHDKPKWILDLEKSLEEYEKIEEDDEKNKEAKSE